MTFEGLENIFTLMNKNSVAILFLIFGGHSYVLFNMLTIEIPNELCSRIQEMSKK